VGGSSILPRDATVVLDRVSIQGAVTHMAYGRGVVGLPVLAGHAHGFGVCERPLDRALLPLESSEEVLCRIWPPVLGWSLCVPVAPHLDIAVAACLVVLRPSGVALRRVELWPFYFGGEGFEVGVDDIWGRQLLVMVLESELVFALLRHLHPYSRLADSLALRLMGFQQILA
jgi:hypothetical protein